MAKIGWYLVFLLTFFLLGSLNARSRVRRIPRINISPRHLEGFYLLSSAVMYLSVLLLARFSDLLIVGFYFLGAQFDILARMAFGQAASDGAPRRHMAEMFWASECWVIRNRPLLLTMGAIYAVMSIGYPVALTIVYFSSTIPSASATLEILRITLLFYFLGNVALYLPSQSGVAASWHLSSATRWRVLASSVATLLPTGVLLATFLSTFSASSNHISHFTLNFHASNLPMVSVILLTYFVISLLAPYLVGVVRAGRWQRRLAKQQTKALTTAIRVLLTPMVNLYGSELSRVVQEVKEHQEALISRDKSISLGLLLDKRLNEGGASSTSVTPGNQPSNTKKADRGWLSKLAELSEVATDRDFLYPEIVKIYAPENYYLARHQDPRFQYLDWLDSLLQDLSMTADDLAAKRGDTRRVNTARAWAERYEEDRRTLAELSITTNTFGAVFISSATTTVVSVFFTGFGNWLWMQVEHSLPK